MIAARDGLGIWRRPALLEALAGPEIYMDVATRQTSRQLVISGTGALVGQGLIAVLGVRLPGYNGTVTVTFSVGLLLMAVLYHLLATRWPRTAMLLLNGLLMPTDIGVALWGAGPSMSPTIAQGAVLTAIVTPILFPRLLGNLLLLASVGVYGVVLAVQAGNDGPGARFLFLTIQAGLVAIVVSRFSELVSGMVAGEQEARQVAEASLERLHVEDARKRSFLARMSHELRTPLNAVIGFSTLLQERRHVEPLNPRQAEYLDDISSSGRHLLGLVDDLLDITLVERGGVGLVISRFPASRVVLDSLALCRQQAADRGVSLVNEPLLDLGEITVDERRTRQILLNLIANAVAATSADGTVTVAARRVGPRIEVSVSDTGPGIDPADQERIFTPYVQGSSGKEGTGLGLALARKFAESQGGELTVESAVGAGATFRLVLPVSVTTGPDHRLGADPDQTTTAEVGLWESGGAFEQLIGVEAQHRFLARLAAMMLAGEAAALLALSLLPHPSGGHYSSLLPIAGGVLGIAALLLRPGATLSPRTLYRSCYPVIAFLGVITWLVGPRGAPIIGSAYVAVAILGFFGQRLRRAIPLGVLIAVSYGVGLVSQPHSGITIVTWVLTMALAASGAALVRWLIQFVPNLAQAERAARDEAEETNARLEAASRHKTEFLAHMSHELRTPLNAILGFAQVLADQVFGPLSDRQVDYVKDILGAGQHLLLLINDILDLAKADAGRLELAPARHPVSSLMDAAIAPHLKIAEDRSLHIAVSVTPRNAALQVDGEKLSQAVSCLVANAVAFTPEDGQVTVVVTVQPDIATIMVTDTGPGIDPADHERVFDEFEQAQMHGPGTGIGLALARRLVEMHGGTLSLLSGPGQGSAFTISLPEAQLDHAIA